MEKEKVSKERQGEIAISLLKWDIKKRNIPDKRELQEHLLDASKNTGIQLEELKNFYLEILENVYGETLSTLRDLNIENYSKSSRKKVGFHNYFKE